MLDTLLGSFGKKVIDLVDKYIENKEKKEQLKQELKKELLKLYTKATEAQAKIIMAEAKSESWLTKNWRPIIMLTFASLLVADWFGYSAPNLPPEIKKKLYDIIELGLGGYIVGRSAEKILREPLTILATKMTERKNKNKKPLVFEDDDLDPF